MRFASCTTWLTNDFVRMQVREVANVFADDVLPRWYKEDEVRTGFLGKKICEPLRLARAQELSSTRVPRPRHGLRRTGERKGGGECSTLLTHGSQFFIREAYMMPLFSIVLACFQSY